MMRVTNVQLVCTVCRHYFLVSGCGVGDYSVMQCMVVVVVCVTHDVTILLNSSVVGGVTQFIKCRQVRWSVSVAPGAV